MGALRGIFAGVLGLALLQAVVSSTTSAGRVGGFMQGIASGVEHALDPNVPLIPDFRTRGPVTPPAPAPEPAEPPSSAPTSVADRYRMPL